MTLVFGAGVAVQSRINGELGRALGDGYVAAVISFGGGLVIVAVVMVASRSGRAGFVRVTTAVRNGNMPWWHVAGGAAGAFFVLSQGLSAAVLGVALFTIAIVCGQTLSGLAIDRSGLGAVQPKRLTPTRIVGSLLALVAVGVAVSAQLSGDYPVWLLVMPFVAGLGIGWQQAVNGQVKAMANSALTATFLNFLVGFALLLGVAAIHASVAGWPVTAPSDWWLYIGGPVGVVFIAGAAIVVRTIGVLLLSLGTVAGQLVTSLVLDVLAPPVGYELAPTTVFGTLLTIAAVAIAAVPARRSS